MIQGTSFIISYIVVALITGCSGFVLGYITRGIVDKKMKEINASAIVLSAVTFVFTISVLVDILSIDYETPLALYGLMGVIVGFFFKPIGGTPK